MKSFTKNLLFLALGITQTLIATPPLDLSYMSNISQKFGVFNQDQGAYHTGIDISTLGVNPPVYAIADGIVVWNSTNSAKYTSDYEKYYNAFVIAKHSGFYAYYGHLNSSLVVNDKVGKGKIVGTIRDAYSGNSVDTKANHLHISISTGSDWITSGWGYKNAQSDLGLFATPTDYIGKEITDNMTRSAGQPTVATSPLSGLVFRDDAGAKVSIPCERLRRDKTVNHEGLPFRIVVHRFFDNSHLKMTAQGGSGASEWGAGARVEVEERPPTKRIDESNVISAVIELVTKPAFGEKDGISLGTWLVSATLVGMQFFSVSERVWEMGLRPSVEPRLQVSPEALAFSKALEFVWAGVELDRGQIAGLTGWELKVLRNAVFARHGRDFELAKLSGFFHGYPKYKIDPNYSDRMMTAVDRNSIQTIQSVEKLAKIVEPITPTNALRAFLSALAGGDVASIHRLVHPQLQLTQTIYTPGNPPEFSTQRKYVGAEVSKLDRYWMDDGMNGVVYCFMMSALSDFTLLPEQKSEGVFQKHSGTEIGFTKQDGMWCLTTISDVTP